MSQIVSVWNTEALEFVKYSMILPTEKQITPNISPTQYFWKNPLIKVNFSLKIQFSSQTTS